jgi:hypothetical protein
MISLTKIDNALEPGVDRSLIEELQGAYNNTISSMRQYL